MKNLILLRVREIVFNRQIQLLNLSERSLHCDYYDGNIHRNTMQEKIIKYLCKGNFFFTFFYK